VDLLFAKAVSAPLPDLEGLEPITQSGGDQGSLNYKYNSETLL
jgi:hypothetical protein